jgi:serine/threonine protein kinase
MMATSGQPKLMDFGIATAGDNRGERRSEGTPTYMAPEQLAGADATTKSDIYSLGLVRFEMLTGSRGVTAGTFDELVRAQETLASDISERLPRASPRLRQAIAQCLAPDPALRPASAHEVSALLQTVVGGSRSFRSQRDTARYDRAGRWRRRAHHRAGPIRPPPSCHAGSSRNRSHLRRRPLLPAAWNARSY